MWFLTAEGQKSPVLKGFEKKTFSWEKQKAHIFYWLVYGTFLL
jgi:hypothetical protein